MLLFFYEVVWENLILRLPAIHLTRPQRTLGVSLLLLIFALQLIHVARVYSINWDEGHHLYDGYNIWTRHDYRLNAEVPPLVKLTAALPLLPMHLSVPADRDKSAFLLGRMFVFENGGDRVLFPARMACMLFTLLLAWLVYAAARDMFGTLAAFLALTFFIFDPNVLAHGTLVSTDLGSACFLFAAVYGFYRYGQAPSWARFGVAALAAGLALVAKFTGIFLIPMLIVLAIADAMAARSWTVLRKRLAACAGVLGCAWVILWAFYGFRYAPAPGGGQFSPQLAPYLQSMPNQSNARELAFVAHLRLLPEPYIWGLVNTKITEWEYTSYFFGRVYRHGPWEYFPAAFLIKSTLPLLILLVLLPFLWSRAAYRHGRELYFLLIPVCIYFAAVTSSHFDIGARHLMPIYPFLYVLAAAGASTAFRRANGWAIAAGLLLAWQVETSVRVAPAYMAYGNEAWGGPLQVHRYLSDANVDWGQQLKAVKNYLDDHHITNCWFAYFPDGAVEPSDYGVECHRLPTANNLSWMPLPMDVPPVINGTVLISDSDLEGIEFGDGALNPYEGFRSVKPIAVIQDGIDVYQGRFAIPLASALVDAHRSQDLAKTGQAKAAMKLAVQGVALAPGSAITQLNLAGVLASDGRWPEALSHYEIAEMAATTVKPDLEDSYLRSQITSGLATARSHVGSRSQMSATP